MSVLIIKNIETEGPGTLEDYLKVKNIQYKIVELSRGERIPDHNSFNSLIILGGPMSVSDHAAYPYLLNEEELVKRFISENKKVLGVCLGAQIMAKALGAKVYRGHEQEIGWRDIQITKDGMKDPMMKSLAEHKEGRVETKFKVFHWHGETFDMPEGAVRLAGSDIYPNQAFRFGDGAYAFQFHVEVNRGMIFDWFSQNSEFLNRLKKATEECYDVYHKRAVKFYETFFNVTDMISKS